MIFTLFQQSETKPTISLGYVCIKKFIIRNWLTQLTEASKSQIFQVSQQARGPGQPMGQFQSVSKVLRTRNLNSVVPAQRPEVLRLKKSQCFQFQSKGRKSLCPSLKAVGQEEFSLNQRRVSLFVLFKPSTDQIGPRILRRAICLMQSTYFCVKLIQKNTLTETFRLIFYQVPVAQSSRHIILSHLFKIYFWLS